MMVPLAELAKVGVSWTQVASTSPPFPVREGVAVVGGHREAEVAQDVAARPG